MSTQQHSGSGAVQPTAFAAPLRARLAEIAAEALATLPPGELPQQLRPVARFAPAKRASAGEQALLAALGTESFRVQLRDWAAEYRPELLRTPEGDPVGAAAAAVLNEDPAMPYLVELVADRAADASLRAERDSALAKLERLGRELAELRASGRSAGGRESNAEADKLRSRLREKGTRLREARDDADAASAALAEVRAEADLEVKRIAAERDAERGRAEHERAMARQAKQEAEAARAAAKQARAADETRLALLCETIEGAAAGLRSELSIGEPGVRPADTVERAMAAFGTSTQVRDAAALDALLRMPAAHLVVDGYNVTKTGYPELSLAEQRDRLARQLAALAARTGAEVTLVFDGAGVTAHKTWPRGVRVLFSDPGVLADDVIRDLVAAEPYGRPLVVATSDKEVIAGVRARRAHAVSSAVLLARLTKI